MLVVLQEVIQWQQSRKFFYWRLRRRLLEAQARKKMEEGGHHLETHAHLDTTLNRWFTEDQGPLNVRLVHLCAWGGGWSKCGMGHVCVSHQRSRIYCVCVCVCLGGWLQECVKKNKKIGVAKAT